MNRPVPATRHARRLAATLTLCAFGLTACGGGGGGSSTTVPVPVPLPVPVPTPTPPTTDIGGSVLSKVARNGVSGTWGYMAPDGSRYAIMGTAKGVLVLDLRDTKNVRVVDEIEGPANTRSPGIYWREMRVYGNHAYIVSEHDDVRGGIMIVDLSGLPASVRFVKSVTPRDGILAAHSLDIDTARGLLYLQRRNSATVLNPASRPTPLFDRPAGMGSGSWFNATGEGDGEHEHAAPGAGAIEIWDIKTDPQNPRYISTFHRNLSVHDMTAVGEKVYVADGEASSFSIWDVKDPAAPKEEVRWSVAPGNFAHNIWPSGDGSFVVTTEELPTGLPARVWQLNGSAPPTQLSSFKIGTGTPHNVIMEGRIAYLSHYTEGAAVVDLTNPAAPRTILKVDTSDFTGPDLNGCWGVYKFPGLPLMMCSDIHTGFHLIGITGQ